MICARSGLSIKQDLAPANKVGIIDADYRGEWCVALHNHGTENRIVQDGDRIAQVMFFEIDHPEFIEVNESELDATDRGEGKFSSIFCLPCVVLKFVNSLPHSKLVIFCRLIWKLKSNMFWLSLVYLNAATGICISSVLRVYSWSIEIRIINRNDLICFLVIYLYLITHLLARLVFIFTIDEFENNAWQAKNTGIKTGFDSVDKAFDGGLYPGFIIIGGDSNLGKTAFLTQLAWQVSQNNNDIDTISIKVNKLLFYLFFDILNI